MTSERDVSGWRGRRVLVTGAAGFLGSHLVYRLHELGASVVGLVPQRAEVHSLDERGLSKRMDTFFGSIRDAGLVSRILVQKQIDACFHLAAVSQVRWAAETPTEAFEDNIQGTWVMLEACRRASTVSSFVLTSSDKAYGDYGDRPYQEDMALRAANTYDVSKACADQLTRAYAHQYGLPAVVVRLGNQYGPGDYNLERVIPGTLHRLHSGGRPSIIEGAERFSREYLYVSDLVDALLLVASRAPELSGEAFNVASGQSFTVKELMALMTRVAGKDVEPEIRPRGEQFREIPYQSLDSSKLRALGWRPRVSFEEGIARTSRWYHEWIARGRPAPLS